MKNLETRRTIRKYKAEDIDEKLLNKLLTLAARTQTMGNLQLYSVVITKDKSKKEQLAPAHFNQPMVTNAPVVLTICADFNRTTKWCENREAKPGYNNFLSFMNAAEDALLYTQTLCCLAEEEGLGYCFLGTTLYCAQKIIEVLQLPKLVMPIATLTIGWPDENPPQTDRISLDGFLHYETYSDYNSTAIDNIYSEKESLEENKKFVKENAKQTLAQVFTDCRYTEKDNIAISKVLIEALKQQQFL